VTLETVAPFWRHRRYRGEMATIQIKHVPEETHAVLRRRAAAAHQSLQEYLLARLVEEAAHPTNAEIFDEIDAEFEREGGGGTFTLQEVVDIIREDRESH
jgi:antitoxin FitA